MVKYFRWPIYVFNSVVNTKLPYQQLVLFLLTKNSLVSSVFFPLLSLRTIEHDKSTEQTQHKRKKKIGRLPSFIAERKAKRVKRVNFLSATYYDHVLSGAISDHHHKFGQNKNNMNIQLFIPTRAVHICLFNSWTNTPEKNGVLPQTRTKSP